MKQRLLDVQKLVDTAENEPLQIAQIWMFVVSALMTDLFLRYRNLCIRSFQRYVQTGALYLQWISVVKRTIEAIKFSINCPVGQKMHSNTKHWTLRPLYNILVRNYLVSLENRT